MSRLQTHKAFKALWGLYGPLRCIPQCRVHSPLRNSQLQALRYLHDNSIHTLFSGPPSYDTINRRFSTLPYLAEYYAKKAAQEEGFVEIHDTIGMQPDEFDVLITDLSDKKLRHEISELMGIEYLAKATTTDADAIHDTGEAIIYGRNNRLLFPCTVRHEDNAYWLFFLIDTGSPWTFISKQAAELLKMDKVRSSLVKIAGRPHLVNMTPDQSHFSEINILGSDFLNVHNVSQLNNKATGKVTLYFGNVWEMVRKKVVS